MAKLREARRGFHSTIDEAFKLIKAFNRVVGDSGSGLSEEHSYYIYEIAFLKVFTAWETLLEESFISYMSGSSISGYKPKTFLKRVDRDRALDLISGTKDYPNWTNIADVQKLAELFFEGDKPFLLPLQQIEIHFNEMKKIRNAIVHVSASSEDKFRGLVRSKLSNYAKVKCPGDFLRHDKKKSKETFFEHYVSYLDVAAKKIIPY